MKKIIKNCLTCCLLLAVESSFAQNIDSLKIELSKAKEDTNKVKLLYIIADEFVYNSPNKTLTYGENALSLSQKLNYEIGQGLALRMIGRAYHNMGDLTKALDYYNRSINLFKEVKRTQPSKIRESQLNIANIQSNIANIHYSQGKNEVAIKEFLSAMELFTKLGDKKGISIVMNNMGNIYYRTKSYSKAIMYYSEGLKIFTDINYPLGRADCLAGIGSVYYEQNKFSESLKYLKEALSIAEQIDNKLYICEYLNNIGNVYKEMDAFDQALKCYNKVLEEAKKEQNKSSIAQALNNIGVIEMNLNNYQKAISLFNEGLKIAKEIGFKELIFTMYLNLSECYATLHNFQESLRYYKLYTTSKDSIYNEENTKQINELSAKYESEKKEKEIILLNKDKELLSTQIQKRNIVLYSSISGAVLAIGFIFLLFNRRLLKQKNKHQTEINKQQESAGISIIQAQEKEQARIAKDLHDSIGTFLSTLKINLQLFEEYIPKEKTEAYQSAGKMIDQISEELRNIMKNLSNETLKEYGLVNAFEELVARVNSLGGTQIDFHSHGLSKRLEDIIEINLYRVGQELLTNCIKYAQASTATLQLIEHENNVLLMVEDNGIGFDTQHPKLNTKDQGMGLKNIRDRIRFIKGKVQIDSVLKRGTTFTIEIPKQLNLNTTPLS